MEVVIKVDDLLLLWTYRHATSSTQNVLNRENKKVSKDTTHLNQKSRAVISHRVGETDLPLLVAL